MSDLFKKELLFKILVVGDFGVGKTSIIKRYAEGTFSPKYKMTIGADFALKQLDWDSETRINIQLWDIAGHERFGYLTSVYYRYAVAAAIVFDLTRPDTFFAVAKWLADLRDKVSLPVGRPLPVIILANKGDVAANKVPPQIEEFCKKNHITSWYVTSAKENRNIDEAMNRVVVEVLENQRNNNLYNSDSVMLAEEMHTDKHNNGQLCCSR
ncbi:ADP ribosylation factor [Oryctes borbonicus]|uniref:Ras-related protein Rab n=1 Tax=Oryctes borbonicus TaxID=1629725 RepID=A0A0T6B6G2_9SCAR|nr:ADP ribosylation factor [Oryctes borbonicus]